MICFLCPTATAAPVITGMLGGSVPRLATFSIISNVSVAILAPMLFSIIGSHGTEMSFIDGFLIIASKVGPLIIAPLALAFLLLATAPKVHYAIATRQSLSFYIWAVTLFIVVGRAVSFVLAEPADRIPEMIGLGVLSLAACLIQFAAGRIIGRACGDKIAGAQGLGQKNTVLAIWMALTYLNPISSVAPAAYIAWQNTINSLQLVRKTRQNKPAAENR
ncbi:MAG: transporter, partial [Muribaculaceae bacterium]